MENDNKKSNFVAISVIAIVTLIVVLVGGTFAYLASQMDTAQNVNISATTNAGNDLFMINPGEDLSISANTENFKLADGNLTANTISDIILQTTSDTEKTVSYSVKLEITNNNFEYSSGTCYQLPSDSTERESFKDIGDTAKSFTSCVQDDGIYGISNAPGFAETGYACYKLSDMDIEDFELTPVTSTTINKFSCVAKTSQIWAKKAVPELIVDLYKNDNSKTSSEECATQKMCVNKLTRAVTTPVGGNCTGTNIVEAPSVWTGDMCFILAASKDITEQNIDETNLQATPINITLLDEEEISASASQNNGTAGNYYMPVVTLVNFEHNQIINGQKDFKSKLTYSVANPEE